MFEIWAADHLEKARLNQHEQMKRMQAQNEQQIQVILLTNL